MASVATNVVMEEVEVAAEEEVSVEPNNNDSVVPSPKVLRVNQRGAVGEGDLSVKVLLGQSHSFGPINVRSEEEERLLKALVKETYDDASHRRTSVHVHAAPQYYSIAERARSVLHPEVVKYIKYAFTVKGMMEHKTGRRRNQYQKRSQVIKIGENGEYIYPTGHPSNATFTKVAQDEKRSQVIKITPIKVAQDEDNNNAAPEVTHPKINQFIKAVLSRKDDDGLGARTEQGASIGEDDDYVPSDDSEDEDWAIGARQARTVSSTKMVRNSTHPMRTRSMNASS